MFPKELTKAGNIALTVFSGSHRAVADNEADVSRPQGTAIPSENSSLEKAASLSATSEAGLAASTAHSAATCFLALATVLREAQVREGTWKPGFALQAKNTYELFAEARGDKPPHEYTRSDASEFRQLLRDAPSDYSKAREFRDLSLTAIIDLDKSRKPRAERLATTTAKRHFQVLARFFDWAVAEGAASNNPFRGFKFPNKVRANQQRDRWTDEEVVALFSTPLWQGCDVHRHLPGPLLIKDHKYWLPLIALYSGLRLEEAAQLYVSDIVKIDGHWAFKLRTGEGRI